MRRATRSRLWAYARIAWMRQAKWASYWTVTGTPSSKPWLRWRARACALWACAIARTPSHRSRSSRWSYKLEDSDAESLFADMVWVCCVGIADPVRSEVPDAMATCQRAGIVGQWWRATIWTQPSTSRSSAAFSRARTTFVWRAASSETCLPRTKRSFCCAPNPIVYCRSITTLSRSLLHSIARKRFVRPLLLKGRESKASVNHSLTEVLPICISDNGYIIIHSIDECRIPYLIVLSINGILICENWLQQ